MFSLINAPAKHRDELIAATRSAKLLLIAAIRVKLDEPTSASKWYPIFLVQTQLARDYFLSIELDGLEEWDALPALKFRYAVQEATRSPNIEEWDTQRIDAAMIDFNHTWQTAGAEPAPQRPSRAENAEPPELQRLNERLQRVYHAVQGAVEALIERTPIEAITKRQVWDWLEENLPEACGRGDFNTFDRYLRDIPKSIPSLFPKQRKGSARSAYGHSVVRKGDV